MEEQLSFVPSGAGPHWLLRVEKRGANTRWVGAAIARLAGVAADDVGYAGLKDRHAVTVQWFSVPARATTAEFWSTVQSPDFCVLDVQANARKLKRGALDGNRFRIRLRNVIWSCAQLAVKLDALRNRGAPNYFGPQRFGIDGGNLDRLAAWVGGGSAPRGRAERGFVLSAARSLMFNAVLARRVAAGDWSDLGAGEVASLEGSGSHFPVTAASDELRQRLQAFDIHPSGPLWGAGEPPTRGRALAYETTVAHEYQEVARLLEAEGLSQERRALRCVVRDLAVDSQVDGESVTMGFALGRGQFATAVLREICEFG